MGTLVMKQMSFFCLMVFCLIIKLPLCFAQITADPVPSDIDPEAASVMDSYFLALAYGDTVTLETLLGGDLLSKRRMLLDNPAYSDNLRNTYQGAEFKILKYENISPDSITVEVLISFAQGETVRKRYQLERTLSQVQHSSFVIVSETTIAEPIQKHRVSDNY